ncbi:hypothetical protein LCGC14_1415690 [marine sediment metagenome]|uniref:Uncharacterized protein n=1 Tax=marine sediment metagenome TaxID=412755 RepID=A0A0F9KE27_9ZZZZ
MSDTVLAEIAVHMGMELYPGDSQRCHKYIDWYIKTKGGTEQGRSADYIVFDEFADCDECLFNPYRGID